MRLTTDVELDELLSLRSENEWLREQVRTLSARLNKQNPADYLMPLSDGSLSRRPDAQRAACRQWITDEAIALGDLDVMQYTTTRMMREIEHLARERKPVDRIWVVTLERDYRA